MLEKQMIKFILSKWNYGNFRIVFWDQEEFHVGNQPAKFSLIFKEKIPFLKLFSDTVGGKIKFPFGKIKLP